MRDRATCHARTVKAVAVLLSIVPAAGALALAFLLWFIWAFPWENAEPHTDAELRAFTVTMVAAGAAFVLTAVVVLLLSLQTPRGELSEV
jgi:ABC-type Fe3+ transport system permease subunit